MSPMTCRRQPEKSHILRSIFTWFETSPYIYFEVLFREEILNEQCFARFLAPNRTHDFLQDDFTAGMHWKRWRSSRHLEAHSQSWVSIIESINTLQVNHCLQTVSSRQSHTMPCTPLYPCKPGWPWAVIRNPHPARLACLIENTQWF